MNHDPNIEQVNRARTAAKADQLMRMLQQAIQPREAKVLNLSGIARENGHHITEFGNKFIADLKLKFPRAAELDFDITDLERNEHDLRLFGLNEGMRAFTKAIQLVHPADLDLFVATMTDLVNQVIKPYVQLNPACTEENVLPPWENTYAQPTPEPTPASTLQHR